VNKTRFASRTFLFPSPDSTLTGTGAGHLEPSSQPTNLNRPFDTMQSAHSSIYSMLLTLLFYTTASVCALRAAAWLSLHALLPALSRLLSHCCTHYLHSEGTSRHGGIPSSSSSLGGSGTLLKLVRTAAGHVLFVPVSISDPGQANSELGTASESIPTPLRRHATLALWFTSFLGTILIAYYPYYYIQAVSTKRAPPTLSCFSLLVSILSDMRSTDRR
jgi:hypothetical protein